MNLSDITIEDCHQLCQGDDNCDNALFVKGVNDACLVNSKKSELTSGSNVYSIPKLCSKIKDALLKLIIFAILKEDTTFVFIK